MLCFGVRRERARRELGLTDLEKRNHLWIS